VLCARGGSGCRREKAHESADSCHSQNGQ
jgi:hypothetical protein